MRRMTLRQFADEHGQTKAACLLGLTQGALNKAISVGRSIFVSEGADGSFVAEELRPFPVQSAKRTAA